jgi:NAD(P)-dependent dehydrogenase (short-subunit alcohol dehydrogenase family)
MAGRLEGRSVVVVGASTGMGRAIALACAREGAGVALAARRVGLLQELGEQITAETGRPALAVNCDVTVREEMAGLLQAARARFGRLDAIVYNAGINVKNRWIPDLDAETWDRILATNLTGAFHCTHLAVPILREQGGGLIIYVSSISGRLPDISGIAYQASKHGLDGIAGGTFIEEKKHGIRTSVIYPGFCVTPLMHQRPYKTPDEVVEHALQPEDVAESCVFLASLPERCHVPELVLMPALP